MNLNNNCTFRKSVMIKNKYVWFDQESGTRLHEPFEGCKVFT